MPLAEGLDPSTSVPVTGFPPHPLNYTHGLPHGRQSSLVPVKADSLSPTSHRPHLRHPPVAPPDKVSSHLDLIQTQDHPRHTPHQDKVHQPSIPTLSTQACLFHRRTELRSPASPPRPCLCSSPGDPPAPVCVPDECWSQGSQPHETPSPVAHADQALPVHLAVTGAPAAHVLSPVQIPDAR